MTTAAVDWPVPAGASALATRRICVCIGTCQRPDSLEQLLAALACKHGESRFCFCVGVVDNDAQHRACAVAGRAAAGRGIAVLYPCEPRKNTAVARNSTVAHVRADFPTFTDDDEAPGGDWLLRMHQTFESLARARALGPVRPRFGGDPPQWIVKGEFCERIEHPTGHLDWQAARKHKAAETQTRTLWRRLFEELAQAA